METEPSPREPKPNMFAVPAAVVGIVAVALNFTPSGIGIVPAAVLGLVAVVLGIIAVTRKTSRGLAIAGTSLGGLAIVIAVVEILILAKALSGMFGNVPVEYEATVSAGDATASLTTFGTTQESFTGTWSKSETQGYYDITAILAVTGDDPDQTLTCTIIVDGHVADSQSGHGGVTCQADLPGL